MRAFEYLAALRATTALLANVSRVDMSPLFLFFFLMATPTSFESFHLGRVSMAAVVATKVSSTLFCAAVLGGVIDVPGRVRDVPGGVRDVPGLVRDLRGGLVDWERGDWEEPMFPRTRAMATASVLALSFSFCLLTLWERA